MVADRRRSSMRIPIPLAGSGSPIIRRSSAASAPWGTRSRSSTRAVIEQLMSDVRRPIEWQQIAVILAVWSFAYGSYRAYYAVGGELGMIGQPSSSAQFRAINAIGAAAIILFGSVVPLAAMYVRAVRRALLILCWIAAVGCCMHALVDIAL